MSANNKRKQDDKHLKILRELAAQPCNKVCFDCHQRGPTYINMTIGSFVCTTCSGHLRGLNPPHRVKSISMASFTPEEIEMIKTKGNDYCKQVWLGLYDEKSNFDLQSKDEQKIKEFMIAKYEKKRFYMDSADASRMLAKRQSESSAISPDTKNETTKSAFRIPAPSSAISRTATGLNSLSKTNGISKPVTKSSSVDLLSGIMSASEHLEKKNSLTNSFAFAPPPSSSPSVPCIASNANENFANFDNANIFSNAQTPIVKSSPIPFPYSSNPLTPLSTSAGSPSSPPNVPMPSTSADKYAALKDLDEAFKFHKEKTTKEPPVTDANYNHHTNGSTQSKAFVGNSNWANFEAQKEPVPFGNTNPWATSASNPFVSTQQPTGYNSYNPFL